MTVLKVAGLTGSSPVRYPVTGPTGKDVMVGLDPVDDVLKPARAISAWKPRNGALESP